MHFLPASPVPAERTSIWVKWIIHQKQNKQRKESYTGSAGGHNHCGLSGGCKSGDPGNCTKHRPARRPVMSAADGRGIQRRRARAAGAWQLGRSDCLQLYSIKLGFPQLECRPRERKEADCCVDCPQSWSVRPWTHRWRGQLMHRWWGSRLGFLSSVFWGEWVGPYWSWLLSLAWALPP